MVLLRLQCVHLIQHVLTGVLTYSNTVKSDKSPVRSKLKWTLFTNGNVDFVHLEAVINTDWRLYYLAVCFSFFDQRPWFNCWHRKYKMHHCTKIKQKNVSLILIRVVIKIRRIFVDDIIMHYIYFIIVLLLPLLLWLYETILWLYNDPFVIIWTIAVDSTINSK